MDPKILLVLSMIAVSSNCLDLQQEGPEGNNNSTTSLESGETNNTNNGTEITVYTMTNFHGAWWSMESSPSGECVEVPPLILQKASSVDTHNACVILFEKEGCKGKHVELSPGTVGHSDLSLVQFDNSLSSWKPCDEDEGGSGSSDDNTHQAKENCTEHGIGTLVNRRRIMKRSPQDDVPAASEAEFSQDGISNPNSNSNKNKKNMTIPLNYVIY